MRVSMHLMSAVLLIGLSVLSSTETAQAYLWRCHTPAGEIWTDQPGHAGDCEEYDPVFNPGAALPPGKRLVPQLRPPPTQPPPAHISPPLVNGWGYDPWLWPYAYAPYYPYYPSYPFYPAYRPYYGSGLYIGPPPWCFTSAGGPDIGAGSLNISSSL